MIEVKNLVKKYGNHLAVDHLNFTIEEGHIYGFLEALTGRKVYDHEYHDGYLGATEGEVLINGHDILKKEPEAKKADRISAGASTAVYGYDGQGIYGICRRTEENSEGKKEQSRLMMWKKLVKIKDVEKRLIKNLSKGYRQRVGLAQAVLGFPEIIILDEPSVGLDPKQIIEIRELIRKLAKKHTVILSSHILAEVREVCDYIMIISKGKLVASDTPENLERYLGESGLIEIETRTEASKVKEVLKNVPGIEKVSLKTDASGITSGQIREKRGQDIREELFTTFAEKKMPLLKLNPVQVSLEDVFMELTQSDKAAEEFARKAKESRKGGSKQCWRFIKEN